MNSDFSSNFMSIYQLLFSFLEEMVCLEIVLKTKYIFLAFSMWECSSVVEHSTADREVGGSMPLAPFFIMVGYLLKDFRSLKK